MRNMWLWVHVKTCSLSNVTLPVSIINAKLVPRIRAGQTELNMTENKESNQIH